MKVLTTIVVIILLACGGALWFLAGGSLNEFVKTQIETVGHQVTEQKVTVDKVDIQLAKGAGSIYGVNLANPAQYKAANAFSLGEITLDINLESLTKEPIIIDAIVIKEPKAVAEIAANGDSNIKDLLDSIKRHLPQTSASSEPQPSDSSASEPRISVSQIVLAGTALSLDLTALGNKNHQLTLPDITLTNIGGKDGLPASQLGTVITKEALSAIWQQAKAAQKQKLKQIAKDKLKEKAKKKLSDLFNKS
ncbi:hypothetical protein tinsulaeT_26450 [Thalassotalea insulae]|uniref:AsmA domain-containing protein n=1 Tax=Thalassotalea insulae TaxID=2056778 RepID=A0ABQ6GTN9_9GAMM|nr:hypothetical protein [Thalassotalea insulae]GLX79305.1 hypothetical protein tinsulaeT_26450 [Thalassotalea insulae]